MAIAIKWMQKEAKELGKLFDEDGLKQDTTIHDIVGALEQTKHALIEKEHGIAPETTKCLIKLIDMVIMTDAEGYETINDRCTLDDILSTIKHIYTFLLTIEPVTIYESNQDKHRQ